MEVKLGYTQTEVGVIPEEWEAAHIGDVCSFSGGSQPPRSTFKFTPTPGYIRLIQIRDYKSDDFASYIPEPLARKRCTSEDIMIGRYGPPIFQILRGIEGAYNVALIKTTPTPKIEREFFFSVLNQEPLFKLIEALSRRSSGQTGVEMPALKAYGLPLPTLPEQRAIATALSDVDGLLGGLDRLIAKKRDLKQAAMQQLLTGQTRLPGFHAEWEVKRLGDVADMGSGGTPPSSVPDFYDGDIPWASISDMTKGGKSILSTDRNLTRAGFANSAAQMFPAGTILYAMYASLGECSIAGISLCSSQAILGIRPKNKLSGEYLYYFLTSLKGIVKTLGQQGTQANLNKGMVQDFRLSLPPLPEQTAIADVMTEMDGELAGLTQRREKTRALKQAMMQELLTGKTRLI